VASPLLFEVNLNYPGNAVTDLTQSHFRQFFKGSEIVVAGRLQDLATDELRSEVSANGVREALLVLIKISLIVLFHKRHTSNFSWRTSLCSRVQPLLKIGTVCSLRRSTSLAISQSDCGHI